MKIEKNSINRNFNAALDTTIKTSTSNRNISTLQQTSGEASSNCCTSLSDKVVGCFRTILDWIKTKLLCCFFKDEKKDSSKGSKRLDQANNEPSELNRMLGRNLAPLKANQPSYKQDATRSSRPLTEENLLRSKEEFFNNDANKKKDSIKEVANKKDEISCLDPAIMKMVLPQGKNFPDITMKLVEDQNGKTLNFYYKNQLFERMICIHDSESGLNTFTRDETYQANFDDQQKVEQFLQVLIVLLKANTNCRIVLSEANGFHVMLNIMSSRGMCPQIIIEEYQNGYKVHYWKQ